MGNIFLIVILLSSALWSPKVDAITKVPPPAKDMEGVMSEYKGILKTGIMVMGGETTGTTLTTEKGVTFELLLNPKKFSPEALKSGSRVKVKGTLTQVPGVEIETRQIINVSEMVVVVQ